MHKLREVQGNLNSRSHQLKNLVLDICWFYLLSIHSFPLPYNKCQIFRGADTCLPHSQGTSEVVVPISLIRRKVQAVCLKCDADMLSLHVYL